MVQMLQRLLNRVRYRRHQDDLAEELAVHRELKAKELAGSGSFRPPDLDLAMGNELRMRELAREVWVPPGLDALRLDLRDALRALVPDPGSRPWLSRRSLPAWGLRRLRSCC
jgi:hypothetical protein